MSHLLLYSAIRSTPPRLEAEKPHPGSSGSAPPPPPPAGNPHPGLTPSTLHRTPVGQAPSGPGWLAIAFGFWSGRALATGTAWAGLCFIHHHQERSARKPKIPKSYLRCVSHPPPCARWPQEPPPGPGWLATPLGFWSGRSLATGTALAG